MDENAVCCCPESWLEVRAMTAWLMEGPYLKSCNCDPGCPCDFNQHPTHGHCEGIAAMQIDSGRYGEVELDGLCWGSTYHWPGALHEGNGLIQPFIDEKADQPQRDALLQILSGQQGGTFFQVLAVVAPNVQEPVFCPIDFSWDIKERTARVRFGDTVESETETLRGIDPPDPYQIQIRIPGGMEYTNSEGVAEIASATRLSSTGTISFEINGGHSSLAHVRHGSDVQTAEFNPTIVGS
jgi:hypothetical protein